MQAVMQQVTGNPDAAVHNRKLHSQDIDDFDERLRHGPLLDRLIALQGYARENADRFETGRMYLEHRIGNVRMAIKRGSFGDGMELTSRLLDAALRGDFDFIRMFCKDNPGLLEPHTERALKLVTEKLEQAEVLHEEEVLP